MNNLDWLKVGDVSAERDQHLKDYFYDAGVSRSLVSNPKSYLLLGRKGAGKTAVFLHLISRPADVFSANDRVVGLSLQAYNWHGHRLLLDAQKDGGFQYRDSWRFVLALECLKAIKEYSAQSGEPIADEIKSAIKTMESIFRSPLPSWKDLLGEKLYSLSKLKLPGGGFSGDGIDASLGEVSFDQIKGDDQLVIALRRNLETMTSWLESCLKRAPEKFRVFLVFDRLDEAWVPDFIGESKAIVSGLLHASEHMLSELNGRIRPLVFLREDIFSALDVNDRNKLKEDCSANLRWSREQIEKLVLRRINFFARQANVPEIASLDELFLEQKIRSKTTPVKHAFNRTMCRPRDMVAFLNKVISAARNDEASHKGGKLASAAMYAAEPDYSEYLYEELSDEWRNQRPNFLDYLRAVENLRYAVFSVDEFEQVLRSKGLANDRAEYRDILRFLFDNSIVGITVGESTQWRYRCFFPNQAFVDCDALKIHPGLIKRLGLTERTSPNVPKDVASAISKSEEQEGENIA
ncbi:P-loop ATPase, Sll1717 family [Xanthomonas sacchari]|uniref:P-loop ATPase, Sll1717 family n=1 Tax=Xanthomonas sacchari TaxID=56458 RepID=UPI00224CCBC8|nr:hypothetical protein [Xanthomonas sacchari]MCW0458378.1 hypothetical protein [Xanthomonas sacchari]